MCLKIGSTVYRFARYYTGHAPYVRKGPPQPLLRLIGPFIVLSTVWVLGTGVLLAFPSLPQGYFGFPLLFLHKLSFLAWAALMTVHVLAYLPRLPRLLTADLHTSRAGRAVHAVGGAGRRYAVLAVSLAAGLILAELGAHLSSTWYR